MLLGVLIMDNTWILIANASTATLYNFLPEPSPKHRSKLTVVQQFEHLDSRKKDTDLVSDREGGYTDQATGGSGNFVEEHDPHKYQGVIFARELFKRLEQGRVKQEFVSLIIAAPPEFMGHLRQCIDDHPFKKVAVKEVTKDYTKLSINDLIEALKLKEDKNKGPL